MSAALCALQEAIQRDPKPYKNLIPSFVSILKQVWFIPAASQSLWPLIDHVFVAHDVSLCSCRWQNISCRKRLTTTARLHLSSRFALSRLQTEHLTASRQRNCIINSTSSIQMLCCWLIGFEHSQVFDGPALNGLTRCTMQYSTIK